METRVAKMLFVSAVMATVVATCTGRANAARALRFSAQDAASAAAWRATCRAKLVTLMMGGERPREVPLDAQCQQRSRSVAGGYALEESTLQSTAQRRVHVWLAVPEHPGRRVGAVLALHGHGGSGEQIVRGQGLYWYGRALAEMGYVVVAPDIGTHELAEAGWTLMGQRVWDALRCIDYALSRPEVDPAKLAVAGLSLGGETAMYVAALDERVSVTGSSGWLTTIDNMKQGHCSCWDFPGLEEHFDFADIFACVAPRRLILEIGRQERAPGGFPVDTADRAFQEILAAYRVDGGESQAELVVHSGGHVFFGVPFWSRLRAELGAAEPWASTQPGPELPAGAAATEWRGELLRRGEISRRCLLRAQGVFDAWWATREPRSGLFPRRLDQPVWAPQDNAADMLPFLLLTAHLMRPAKVSEVEQLLARERQLTNRLGVLPDWYSLEQRQFVHPEADLERLIFNAAEYCKDGLVPMTEFLGPGPWLDRWRELLDAIFEQAPVDSRFGKLPSNDAEVNGDLLQALCRLFALTREPRYREWAQRLGDAYCLEVLPTGGFLPPQRWDFQEHRATADILSLNDHGNELIGGLAELYVMVQDDHSPKAQEYRPVLTAMFHRLLEKARNEDGLWRGRLRASTGEVLQQETPDTWGYALAAMWTYGTATGDQALIDAVGQALRGVDRPCYLQWEGADSYADSIEGALVLLNRVPEPAGFRWLEQILPLLLTHQRDDGIVEGWYGDGNFARTAIMAALYHTQGARCSPWPNDLRLGAMRRGQTLCLVAAADQEWAGTLSCDTSRHREPMRLPFNYARLNEFPEWYPTRPDLSYQVRVEGEPAVLRSGKELAAGVPLALRPNRPVWIEIEPVR